jgi:hypothetical protein
MSCQYPPFNIAPYQDGVNATLIPGIGNTPLPPNSDTKGTYNKISFGSSAALFSGSYGDTCGAGYYTTYDGNLDSLVGVMDFNIIFPSSTYCIEPGPTQLQQLPFTTNKTFGYAYYNKVQADFTVSGKACTYIPAIKGEPCSDSTYYCFGDPSLGVCAACVSDKYTNAVVTANLGPDNISLSYVTGSTLPSGYDIVASYEIELSYTFSPIQTLYFYDFDVTNMKVSVGDVSVSVVPEPPGGWDVSQFNDVFNGVVSLYLVPYLNTLIKNQAFEFKIKLPPDPFPPIPPGPT